MRTLRIISLVVLTYATLAAQQTVNGVTNQSVTGTGGGGLTLVTPGDINYTVLTCSVSVAHSAFSVSRTDTLPAASSCTGTNRMVFFMDALGVLTSSKTLSIQRAGSDTINLGVSSSILKTAFAGAWFESDGVSNWTVHGDASSIISGDGFACTLSAGIASCSIDATVAKRLGVASGVDVMVVDSGASGTAFGGCPASITPPLTSGMVVRLLPAHNSSGGATTFNYCSTSAIALKEADGATLLTSVDLVTGQQVDVWYDGTIWRLKAIAGVFYDVKISPSANCNGAAAGAGWNLPASGGYTAACRAGTNNLSGVLQGIPSTGAYGSFVFELPSDYVTTIQPWIKVFYASGANTSGTVIFTISTGCTKADGSVTDDAAWVAESAMPTQTMAVANRGWAQSMQLTTLISGNSCVPGSLVRFKVAVSGTAGSAINVSQATVTVPRLPVAGAQ